MRPRYYRCNGEDAFTAGIAEARRVREEAQRRLEEKQKR